MLFYDTSSGSVKDYDESMNNLAGDFFIEIIEDDLQRVVEEAEVKMSEDVKETDEEQKQGFGGGFLQADVEGVDRVIESLECVMWSNKVLAQRGPASRSQKPFSMDALKQSNQTSEGEKDLPKDNRSTEEQAAQPPKNIGEYEPPQLNLDAEKKSDPKPNQQSTEDSKADPKADTNLQAEKPDSNSTKLAESSAMAGIGGFDLYKQLEDRD